MAGPWVRRRCRLEFPNFQPVWVSGGQVCMLNNLDALRQTDSYEIEWALARLRNATDGTNSHCIAVRALVTKAIVLVVIKNSIPGVINVFEYSANINTWSGAFRSIAIVWNRVVVSHNNLMIIMESLLRRCRSMENSASRGQFS